MTPERLRQLPRDQRLAWFARQAISECWDGDACALAIMPGASYFVR